MSRPVQWRITEIKLTEEARRYGARVHYRYHVRGVHLENGAPFSWTVADLDGFELAPGVSVPELPTETV